MEHDRRAEFAVFTETCFLQTCLRMDEDRPQSMYENWRELTVPVPGSKDKKQKRSKKSIVLYDLVYYDLYQLIIHNISYYHHIMFLLQNSW